MRVPPGVRVDHRHQDTIGKHGKPGSRDQCLAAVKRALTLGKHVAVDRCHLTEEQRAFSSPSRANEAQRTPSI